MGIYAFYLTRFWCQARFIMHGDWMPRPKTKKANGPIINMRYENTEQVDRFKAAAYRYRWSLNTFMLVAAERFAGKILKTGKQVEKDSTDLGDLGV